MGYTDVLRKHTLAKREEILMWLFRYITDNVSKDVGQYMLVEERSVFNQRAGVIEAGLVEILCRHFQPVITKLLKADEEFGTEQVEELNHEKWEVLLHFKDMGSSRFMKLRGLGRVLDHIIRMHQTDGACRLMKAKITPTNRSIVNGN